MSIIQQISLSQFTTKELQKTATVLPSIVNELAETHPYIARNVSHISNAVDILVDIDNTIRGSELSDVIDSDDDELDSLLPLCKDHLETAVKSIKYYPLPAAASVELLKLWNKRDQKELVHGGYSSQGKEVTALLKDIFHPSQDENRAASGVEPMLLDVKASFESLQKNLEARLNEGNFPSTQKEQKKILRYRLDLLLSYIDGNVTDGINEFEAVKTPVNELITEMMSEYRSRVTRKANKSK